ncbi:hypothetical protein KI387_014148, partial [Taxus chinensis]
MPFLLVVMNHQTLFDHPFSFSVQNLYGLALGDFSQSQTLVPAGSFNDHQESMKVPDQTAAVPQPLDDLSAVVHKCNLDGFHNPFLSVEKPAISIPHSFQSQDFNIHSEHKIRGLRINREEEEMGESLKRKRYLTSHLLPSSSLRESHIVSERLRRIEMNELLAQLRSLLPNPTAKSDKASIVTETIKYIQSLKRGLALHSKKPATTRVPNAIKSEAMSSVPKTHRTPLTKSDQSMSSKYRERNEYLTVKHDGKDIFITIYCMNKTNLLPSVILAVESHDTQVIDAFVSVMERVTFLCLHVK